nr:MAG TPA: hypothetical protein [Caudoviricetes sp.]
MLITLIAIAILAIVIVNSALLVSVRAKVLHLEQVQWKIRMAIEEARIDTINDTTCKEGTGV